MTCAFIPPYLLRRLAEADATLEVDARMRATRSGSSSESVDVAKAAPAWTVHTAANREVLPGQVVRRAGDPDSGDAAVDEAATGIKASLALTADYGRSSYDGHGAPVSATVHFGRAYDNAFWDGRQLVFGDGDGRVFGRFTRPVDVLGHEFAHAVTQYAAGLVYQDQPGALNESLSDVFAACLKQRLLGQSATEGDWLIGAGLFLPGVTARALRDMAAPGTAYDDPLLGKDPQVGHLDDLVVTEDDNGGVHLNSGIPNRAFHLAATTIGGTSWEGAGRIWWAALTGGSVRPTTDFAAFAAVTLAAAGVHQPVVEEAWRAVGVAPGTDAPEAQGPEGGPARDALVVRRSGGFLGRTVEARRDLTAGDPVADEARELLGRIDFGAALSGLPMPDMFSYTFQVPGRPPVTVPQQHLTPELQRLAALVLGDATPSDEA